MVSYKYKGSWKDTFTFFNRSLKKEYVDIIKQYAQKGVDALVANTPVDSGDTAESWSYEVITDRKNTRIVWRNSNMAGNIPVAILLQYGHATGTGGYVQGQDFINPAIRPIFDDIADSVWKEVTRE